MGQKFIIAYEYLDGILNFNEKDIKKLTHINLAFGSIGKDGGLCTSDLRHLECLDKIRKWNPDIKIVLSVGGWGCGGFSKMSSTQEGRQKFALSCSKYVEDMSLDGIDIDWEYPCIDWAGIDADKSDKQNYTYLLEELRKVLKGKILSVAVGAEDYFIECSEMDKVAKLCDYIQLMTYDMRANGYFTAGHHTSLYSASNDLTGKSVDDSVKRYIKAGVPKEKIVIGAAFYSRMWQEVMSENNGLLQPAKSDGQMGPTYTQIARDYVNKNGYVRYWDEEAMAPYLFNGKDFISYDDEQSIKEKCEYVKAQELLGIMYWEHGLDETHSLLNSMDLNA